MSIDMTQLHVADDSFWTAGNRALDPVVRKHGTSHFGVIVDAPREVNLAGRATLPVFTYYMGSFKQMVTRSYRNDSLLAVMDVDRNDLYICSASSHDEGEDPDPDDPPAKTEPIPDGYAAQMQTIELRERLELPWRPAHLILQAILLDLASPRVTSRLGGTSTQFKDPEVEKYLAAERAAVNPSAPFPVRSVDPNLSYRKTDASPELPAAPGISLRVDRVVAVEKDQPVLLHGAWRLPVMPEDLVKPANVEYNQSHGLLGPDGAPYGAVVRIHLLVVGAADGAPKVYPLALPVSTVTDGSASGYFTLDIAKLPGFPIADQTVFFYAFSRESASEQAIMGMLDRRQH